MFSRSSVYCPVMDLIMNPKSPVASLNKDLENSTAKETNAGMGL
jgi:hypothetical protein